MSIYRQSVDPHRQRHIIIHRAGVDHVNVVPRGTAKVEEIDRARDRRWVNPGTWVASYHRKVGHDQREERQQELLPSRPSDHVVLGRFQLVNLVFSFCALRLQSRTLVELCGPHIFT